MRASRWLFLAAIFSILALVGATYLKRREGFVREAPAPPPPLERGVDGRASDWVYTQSEGDRPRVTVRAKSFRQIKEPSVMELNGVELQLFHTDGKKFDLVKCARAEFDMAGRSLYSEGVVEIIMGVREDTPPGGRVVKIHTSGARFASDTGKTETTRAASFEFERGSGSAVGAEYDPSTRELHMASKVVLDWTGKAHNAPPMHVEAGEAIYRESESKVILHPWSRLTRGTLRMDAGMSVVLLEQGAIQRADIQTARGVQDAPGRIVEFAGDQLALLFAEGNLVEKIEAERNARLVSTAATTRTTVTSDRLDLDFALAEKDSTLTAAMATGHSVAEAVPLPQPGALPSETRVLKSEVIRLKMREGGREIDTVETAGPGSLDFLPNRPTQAKRTLKGDQFWIAYGAENRIQSFRSTNVQTRTDKPGVAGKPAVPPLLTASREITASFDPNTSELSRLEQKSAFKYDEGDRHAQADRAVLEQPNELMTLDGSARVWDPTGSAAADRIVMNQKSGDYTAEGHVASTRAPDKKGSSSAMLSNEEVLQARAQRMTSSGSNKKIHYEGSAAAWQGANRVEADTLDIDRDRRAMEAHGHVVSQFADKPNQKGVTGKAAPKAATAPVFTVVRASDMVYSDETRMADYQGSVSMTRPDLTVTSQELRAFLKDASADSSLDRAFADGAVKIVSASRADARPERTQTTSAQGPGARRTRTGTSDHAEYYADDGRVILQGGNPLLVDSLKGKTTGQQLTWFANNDRLLVDGIESKPAESTIRKKK